jgi:ornithine cyclodeaminase/alanine dehydrogenase-like protein (mu-crystallin family)
MTRPGPTVVLTRSDVRRLLSLPDCVRAVEDAFRRHGEGLDPAPRVLGLHVADGGFHAKAAVVGDYFATKLNANFPLNPGRSGLPTIQGAVLLARTADGQLLAVIDSIEITAQRTAAATVLAARALARRDATVATICGCGTQGAIHLEALAAACTLEHVFVYDVAPDMAARLAREAAARVNVAVEPIRDLEHAVGASDIVVTCTTSRTPLLRAAHIRPGTFIAAVGADSEDKQELDPEILARATVVVDSLEQCAAIGELHHALAAGLMTRETVHAELGQLAAGRRCGRTSPEEITVFDSTGTALQDAAAAALVYERAREAGVGLVLELAS